MSLEEGQVLWLKIRYDAEGNIAEKQHPYLILSVLENPCTVLVAQLDSLDGKEHKAAFRSNKVVCRDNPQESVIDKDSYVRLDDRYTIDVFDGLESYRRTDKKLSGQKLSEVKAAYTAYRAKHRINENRMVHMTEEEITKMNPFCSNVPL